VVDLIFHVYNFFADLRDVKDSSFFTLLFQNLEIKSTKPYNLPVAFYEFTAQSLATRRRRRHHHPSRVRP
jgi:hypothetical protein